MYIDIIKIYLIAAIISIILSLMIYRLIIPKETRTSVYAKRDGVVRNILTDGKYYCVIIGLGNSVERYEYLSEVYVEEKEVVVIGQIIGETTE